MKHIPATIIIIAYTFLALTYSLMTPLGEGPDEPGHAAYVFFLAREGRLPDQRANEVPGEGHQPPLAYALAAPMLLWMPREERMFDLPGNSRFVWVGGDQTNAVAHGSREYWPWRGEVLAWHLARLVSVACGGVTVGMTYLIARRLQIADCRLLRLESAMPLLAAGLVAFSPQFLFASGLISNDALLAALSATMLWLCVRGLRDRARPTVYAATLGLVLGLALLTKQSAVVLVPLAVLAVVLAAWHRGERGPRLLLNVLLGWTLVFGVAVLVCGWWYARNWQLYGDPLGLAVFQAEFATQPFDIRNAAAWREGLLLLHNSFWARFGWMNVQPPAWVIGVFTTVEAVALVGWGLMIVRRTTNMVQWLLVGVLFLTTLAWVVAFAVTAGLVAWQGRMLFPAIAAIAILLASGTAKSIESIGKRGNLQYVSLVTLHSSLFALALWLPFGVIRSAYPFETLPERAALARLGTPANGRFGLPGEPGAELRGWSLAGPRQAGETVQLTLIWHALGRQNRDWTVFVHLVDGSDEIVAESNAEPRAGAFPMGKWVAGDWIEDTQALVLPPTLAPGIYTLRVGLFDASGTQERTGVWDDDGDLVGDYLELGTIEIRGKN